MTNEELEKRIEFIIEQQAQLVVSQQKSEERATQLEDLVIRLTAVTSAGFKDLGEKITALVDAQIKTDQNVSTLAEKMTELAEAQVHTDRRLDALIDIIREGRNENS